MTALMHAVNGGSRTLRTEAVAALLDAGADPEIRDREGRTALSIARERKNDEVVQLLAAKK